MAEPIFAFGPRGRFFYKTLGRRTVSSGLPASIQSVIDSTLASDIICVALGPSLDSYYFAYTDVATKTSKAIHGSGLPQRLTDILTAIPNHETENIKVVLGPGDGFVVWNIANPLLLWGGDIPDSLSTVLRGWYRNLQWTAGPPCFITLGVEETYFAVCEGHSAAYRIGERFSILKDVWMALWRDLGDFSAETILYMSISPCVKDRFIIIERSQRGAEIGRVYVSVSQGIQKINGLLLEFDQDKGSCWDNLPGDGLPGIWCTVRKYYKKREPNELTLRKTDVIEVLKKCSKIWWFGRNVRGDIGYFPARYIELPEKEEAEAEAAPVTYIQWLTDVKRILGEGNLKRFPPFPDHIGTCGQPACYEERKDPDGIRVCRHDVEAFLRTSRSYSFYWLKTQRLQWHPDQFGKRCDPEFRTGLCQKAERLFVIFGLLMDEEGAREYQGLSD